MIQAPEWLVCFYDPLGPRYWWRVFTRKTFGHCAAIGYMPDIDKWLVVDVSLRGLASYLIEPAELTPVLAALHDIGHVLRWKPPAVRPRYPVFTLSLNCVTMTGRLLGFRCRALTPHGLFCALRRAGAVEMFKAAKESADELDERSERATGLA